MSDAPVDSLPEIGPATLSWLKEIDIRSVGDLRSIGSVEAYRRLKFMLPRRVSLNALYALEARLPLARPAAGREIGASAAGQDHR